VGPWLIPLATAFTPFVTHGSYDAMDPAVVAIVDSTGQLICSGTVIDPHFVLTAAHCVLPTFPSGSRVVVGGAVGASVASVAVAGYRADPGFNFMALDDDAALLVLAEAAPVTPVPLGAIPPAVGSTVSVVGFGETSGDAGDYGTKRDGTARVTALGALTFQVAPDPSQPCAGDSGGPALATVDAVASVVGITSHGDTACTMGATYTRVDAVAADFIAPTMAALGSGTVGAGERCLYAEQCVNGAGACVPAPDQPGLTYCTEGCSVNADCPQGMICVSVTNGSQCRYPVPTPGAFGGACGTDSDCVAGTCLGGTCTFRCAPTGDDTCPNGAPCQEQADGIDFFCVPQLPTVTGSSCAVGSSSNGAAAACMAGALLVAAGGRRRRLSRAAR
jgi:hypothetical protein